MQKTMQRCSELKETWFHPSLVLQDSQNKVEMKALSNEGSCPSMCKKNSPFRTSQLKEVGLGALIFTTVV